MVTKKDEKDIKAKKPAAKKKTAVKKKPAAKTTEKKPVAKKSTTKKTTEAKKVTTKTIKKVATKKTAIGKKNETPSKGTKKKTDVKITDKDVKVTDKDVKVTDKVVAKKETKKEVQSPKDQLKEQPKVAVYKPNYQKKQRGSTKNRKKYKKEKREQAKVQAEKEAMLQEKDANIIEVKEALTVNVLADSLSVNGAEIITKLMGMGVLATLNQRIDSETAEIIADEYGFQLKYISVDEFEEEDNEEYDETDYKKRPPVITIMGHVDHGKTSLLDVIRETDVVSGEAGGITQHIGAYQVTTGQGLLTFLDTPGHAAFTAMRARGAQVTDIVVLVVAADDGVMPQTIEAIDHAKAAGVPIIIAVNKMDVAGANPDKVLQDFGTYGLVPEEWGGNTIVVRVSAKEKTGIKELLEMISIQADMMELVAPVVGNVKGVVVEAELDKKRGPVATILIEKGILKKGDVFIAGEIHGKVRFMTDDKGIQKKEAYPSSAVEILGFGGVPNAGDIFRVVENEKKAKQIAQQRHQAFREERLSRKKHITLEALQKKMLAGEVKDFNVILKADVKGSVEALKDSLERMSTDEVKLNVIHYGVGAVTESDVMLAVASDAIIFSFNIPVPAIVKSVSEVEGVEIREYNIIYEIIEQVKAAMEGMLTPGIEQELVGRADVRQIIRIPRFGIIAGAMVIEGKIIRDKMVKVLRGDEVLHESTVSQLKRFKENVKEVEKGFECGISIEGFDDFAEGDVIEVYEEKKVLRKLET